MGNGVRTAEMTLKKLCFLGMVQELKRINVNADSQCFKKSVEASCYYHLPICIKRPGGLPPIPKKLCKHECEAIYDICRDYFLNGK